MVCRRLPPLPPARGRFPPDRRAPQGRADYPCNSCPAPQSCQDWRRTARASGRTHPCRPAPSRRDQSCPIPGAGSGLSPAIADSHQAGSLLHPAAHHQWLRPMASAPYFPAPRGRIPGSRAPGKLRQNLPTRVLDQHLPPIRPERADPARPGCSKWTLD